jgi:hypothetical protein
MYWSHGGRRAWRAAAVAIALVGLIATPLARAADRGPTRLHVATWGKDSWPGTEQRPFATLHRAQRAVRAHTAGMTSDIVVSLREGTYELPAPLRLSSRTGDSGMNGHRVVYQAYGYGTRDLENVVISGGRSVTGWRLVDPEANIWRADVGDLETRQLFVNGRRRMRASLGRVATRQQLGDGIPGTLTKTDTGYITDSVVPQSWSHPSDIEFVYKGAFRWSEPRCGVASITGDAEGSTITMDQPCFRWVRNMRLATGRELTAPTSVENSLSFLREPGTFYLDRAGERGASVSRRARGKRRTTRRAGSNRLYYVPLPGEKLARVNVVAPALEQLVVGEGTDAAPLRDVSFKGLTFSYATWLAPNKQTGFAHFISSFYENGDAPPGAWQFSKDARHVPGNIVFHHSDGILLEGGRFTHLGAVGVEFSHSSSDNVIRGNVFNDISSTGITMGVLQPETTGINRNNLIENNWIHHTGAEYHGGSGLFLQKTQDTTVRHNQVNDTAYTGILFGQDDCLGDCPELVTRRTHVLDNLVYDTLQVLSDGGGIYSSGPQGSSYENGALVKGNVVYNSGFIGLYTDQSNKYVTVDSNVTYDNWKAFGGCSDPMIDHLLITRNFWDDDQPHWDCGPLGSDITVVDNTKLIGTRGFNVNVEEACNAIAACAAIVRNAGLEPRYRYVLRQGD